MVLFSTSSPAVPSSSSVLHTPSSSSSSSSTSSFDQSYKEKTSYMTEDDDDNDDQQQKHQYPPSSSHLSSSLTNLSLYKPSSSSSDSKSSPSSPTPAPSTPSSVPSLAPSQSYDPEEEKYTLFLNWLRTNGAKFPHLTLRRYAADYRGVHVQSRTEIPKGKTLLRIPHALLITVELAKSSPIGAIVATLPNIGSQAILAVYLIQEKGKGAASFWKSWLDVLPQSFSTLPMFFNQGELAELSGCHELLTKIKSQQKSMRDEYNSIQRLPGISQFPHFSYDEFVWAALAVGTRVFSLCINNAKTSVLAPLADMMNHKNPAGSSWSYCNRKEAFTLTSCCAMFDGEAVYESYGVKDNKRFFASYGFCLEDNTANEVGVVIKGELMGDERQSRSFVVRQAYDGAMEEMMSFLRMVNAYDYQVESERSSTPSSSSTSSFSAFTRSSFTVPISVDNELSALYALRCACKEHLSSYPTKLEHDLSLLHSLPSSDSTTNQRNILIFRIGEKKIYKWLIDFSSLGIALLCLPWDEARGRIKGIMERGEEGEYAGMMGYVSGVVAPLLQERNKVVRRGTGLSARMMGRRMSQDVDRKMMGMAGYSREEEEDDEEDEEDDPEDDDEEENEKDTDSSLPHYPHDDSPIPSLVPLPLSSSKRSSLTGALPPVTSSGRFGTNSSTPTRSSLVSSFSPSMSPSCSPPLTFTSRHLPRSAASSRSSVPRILPAMPPVSRASSHASALPSSTVTGSSSSAKSALTSFRPGRTTVQTGEQGTTVTTSISPLPSPIPRLPSTPLDSVKPLPKPSPTRSSREEGKGVRGNEVMNAPSPTPSTSDDSQDEQGTPTEDESEGEEGEEEGAVKGNKANTSATSERRRAVHCAQ